MVEEGLVVFSDVNVIKYAFRAQDAEAAAKTDAAPAVSESAQE
jgi:hypothetical protein